MCGIAGIYTGDRWDGRDREPLERMVAALRHRGPDGCGQHFERGIALGHARLSIIDLAGGAQPIHNEDATVWISFNGEIFNYIELRKGLEARGHRFTTQTDTEVLVHLYEDRGDAFVDELNGQFAFAIWDRPRRRLVLGRDRAGILPLFYSKTPGGVIFGSEVKALLASGLIRPELDPTGLDELFTFWAPVAPRTVFKGVQQLRPGEVITFREPSEEPQRKRYWQWQFPSRGEHRSGPPSAFVQDLRHVLEDATQIRLRADVPVGAYLSGGLDSSALVALVKAYVPDMLQTFSIGFDDAALDESLHQQRVVKYLQTDHHHVQCSRHDIAAGFPTTILHAETPVLRTAPGPMRMLSASARAGNVKVVLTGEGADEVLGGYDIFKEAKVRHFWARNAGSSWRSALLKRLYPYLDLTAAQSSAYLKEFFGVGLDDPDDPCFSHLPRWATTAQCKVFYGQEWAAQVEQGAIARFRESLPAAIASWHPFNRAEFVEATTLLPGYLLAAQGDRMLMASSLEGRFPFLDHRLIEYANTLAPRLKMRVLKEKHLLKQTMRDALPEETVGRHKQPYRAPDAVAFLGDGAPDYVSELMGSSCIARYGYFDPQKVVRLLAKLRRSRVVAARDNMAFMGILSTQLWHATFVTGERALT